MSLAGFKEETTLENRLRKFPLLLQEIKKDIPAIARLADLEAKTYETGHFSTYFAGEGLITVFIDSTERSPTFRLYPLDTVNEPKRKCWIQVWTEAPDLKSAWQAFLGRPFRGLKPEIYQKPFEEEINDPYLREKALTSLTKAGDDQQLLYDFSLANLNIKSRGPKQGDIGVTVLLGPEVEETLKPNPNSSFSRFGSLFAGRGALLGIIIIQDKPIATTPAERSAIGIVGAGPKKPEPAIVQFSLPPDNDPFRVQQHIALKMLLNAHSTAVMAKLGKVIGNTMTNVSPSNLKLIGRATYLIQLHVNDVLGNPAWVRQYGTRRPISYGEANAVLFDSIAFMKESPEDLGQAAEVPLSIIRILESLRQRRGVTPEGALEIVKTTGLAATLANLK
jgi:hypothetical protein